MRPTCLSHTPDFPPRLSRLPAQAGLLALALAAGLPAVAAEEPVEFNRDIRPLLTRHCTACHGGVKAAGGVSFLDRRQAMAAGDSGKPTIVPNDPAASEILRRVRSTDPDVLMPPPDHGKSLSTAEIDTLERWIRQGAPWQEHWSFVPPVEESTPETPLASWASVPLDHFVARSLVRHQVQPAPEAPAHEWLRRVSLDLTGLPPGPAEVEDFTRAHALDPSAAREAVVDRLLHSPHYGERWAAMWLDLARYSDTTGFEKDPHRDIWPYRDWVIRAFNQDMPYDRFTIEQLAGDLLPDATADQRLATAFHRNTQTNTEGGTDDEEYRVAAVIDRVATTWTTWQATTFGCVQCHAHPYDPFPHEDFFRFSAFFDNTEDHDLDDEFPKMHWAQDPGQREQASQLERRIEELREALHQSGRPLAAQAGDWQIFRAGQFQPSHGQLEQDAAGAIRATGTLPVGTSHTLIGTSPPFQALRISILPESDDPKKWPERGSVVSQLRLRLVRADGEARDIPLADIVADHLAGSIDPQPAGPFGDFPKLHAPRHFVVVPAAEVVPEEGEQLEIFLKYDAQTTGNQATPVRHLRIELSALPAWREWAADPARAALRQQLGEARQQLAAIPSLRVPVLAERPAAGRRDTRLFARGNRLSKEQSLAPGLPALLAPEPDPQAPPADRLTMARWLVDGKNPLTARVLANRLWAELFGIGIVETAEDFGSSGTAPSDQALLDHLALRLQNQHQWSIRAFLREVVLSSTYRQTHHVGAEAYRRDPQNRLLARGPRTRLSAEMVRDQALAVAGLLSPKMHGPPVFPPQPAGVWKSVYSGAQWNESQGEDRLRRGIYTYHKRTGAFPGFLSFDAPSRDLCTARRIATNTPLQALVTLNDPAHIEAARGLAERMRGHSEDPAEQLRHGFSLVTQQPADPATLADLQQLLREATELYAAEPETAAKLADSPAQAALVLTANTLLNLDEALNR